MKRIPMMVAAGILAIALGLRDSLAESQMEVTSIDGGSVTTSLGYGIAVKKNSSLRRQWFVINDATCPLTLAGAGINTAYSSRNYSYKAVGSVAAKDAVAAFEVRFMLFDVWGNHMRFSFNLCGTLQR